MWAYRVHRRYAVRMLVVARRRFGSSLWFAVGGAGVGLGLCGGCVSPSMEADPWAELVRLPPEPMREILRISLGDPPQALGVVETTTYLVDTDRLRVLDSRYRHDPAPYCLPVDRWEGVEDDPDRRGVCAAGEVMIQRGAHRVNAGIAGVIGAGSRVWVLDREGQLSALDVDPLLADPLDLGRLVPQLQLEGPAPGPGTLLLTDPEIILVESARIRRWTWDGAATADEPLDLPARGAALVNGEVWVLTSAGVQVEGELLSGEPLGPDATFILSNADGGGWISAPGSLRHVDEAGRVTTVEISGVEGPIAAWESRLYAAAGSELVRIEPTDGAWAETARVDLGGTIRHLAAGAPGELRVALADGTVSVRFDDDRVSGGPPLHVWISGPIENPKATGAGLPCRGGSAEAVYPESIDAELQVAEENITFLQDVPAPTLIPLTRAAADAMLSCGRGGDLRPLLAHPRVEAGLFVHELPEDCATDACYQDFLDDQIAPLLKLGIQSPMITGAAEHTRAGLDWTRTYGLLGVAPRFPLFAMSLWPQIPKEDPRKKDPFTVNGLTPSRAWRVGDAYGDVGTDDPLGGVTMLPGDNIPGYFLGDCANLTVDECNGLQQGGGATFDAEDVAVLDLLLTRALAQRDEEGIHTWTFHLPAIERFAYTETCSVSRRRWSGDTCEAAMLQDWFLSLHQRWALSGEIRWAKVSEIPTL